MSPDPEAIRDLGQRAASRNRDSHPTGIYWVEANRAAIADLIGWGLGANEDGTRMQILVLVTGSFNKHPRGGKSPTGTALTLVLNPDLSATDFGCGDQTVTRLARLGPVHQVAVG